MSENKNEVRPSVIFVCFVLLTMLIWAIMHLTREEEAHNVPTKTAVSSDAAQFLVDKSDTNPVPEWAAGIIETNPGVTKVAFRADKNDLHDQLTRRLEEVRQKNKQ